MLEEMEEHNALNDELEEAHIETEKQMQEEIGEYWIFSPPQEEVVRIYRTYFYFE